LHNEGAIAGGTMNRTVRRLAAILAADVVGYSRKIEADEGSTLAALKDVRAAIIDPLLAEHGGRITKTMGDGSIAEFGSVVEAVAFAVAMQRAVRDRQAGTAPERRLVFRVGINLGDVVVEGDDLLGDGVNVAARFEQICRPGGILISGTAYDQLQGKLGLPLDFIGEQQVKDTVGRCGPTSCGSMAQQTFLGEGGKRSLDDATLGF
jgi:class 3 adenylate cyclase